MRSTIPSYSSNEVEWRKIWYGNIWYYYSVQAFQKCYCKHANLPALTLNDQNWHLVETNNNNSYVHLWAPQYNKRTPPPNFCQLLGNIIKIVNLQLCKFASANLCRRQPIADKNLHDVCTDIFVLCLDKTSLDTVPYYLERKRVLRSRFHKKLQVR